MLAHRYLVYFGILFLISMSLRLLQRNQTTIHSTATTKLTVKRYYEEELSGLSIRPGDLPGYTGWGRSESTLAPFFRITEVPSTGIAGSLVRIIMECQGNSLCETSRPSFFVRAYGPSIITGQVNRIPDSESSFEINLRPIDPGSYHVEIVLTFSDLPDFGSFPLPDAESFKKHLYEGYHVSGSPFQLNVIGQPLSEPSDLPLCKPEQLVETSRDDKSRRRARWRVIDNINSVNHQRNTLTEKNVTLQGYQESFNSLGIVMDYQFEDCRLMPEPTHKINLFQCVREPLHIILIGDSTFRLQEKVIRKYVAFNPLIRVSFLELYGGYFKTQYLTGPNVSDFLAQTADDVGKRMILFNTGLHDIHRLCGGEEMIEDRLTYLRSDMPRACVDMYKIAISKLAEDIAKLPETDIKIFQTTTAAWQKYGNYGVAWDPRYGQPLPLDTSFIEYFNAVAVQTLRQYPNIQIIDGFYVSLSRPDHREVDAKSALGRKLSHPGVEVISAMVRMWSMLILQDLCQ